MQNPTGAHFNYQTMRMELASFAEVLFNPVAQAKFVHTVAAGYVVGSVFVLAISAWYLLRGRNVEIAKRSMAVAASFGLACALSVVVLGDESGYVASENQKMKIAAIEAEWHTEPAPAAFTVFGFPDVAARTTHAEVKDALAAGPDRDALDRHSRCRASTSWSRGRARGSASGMQAYAALAGAARGSRGRRGARRASTAHQADLGYGLLLLRYVRNPALATPRADRSGRVVDRAERAGVVLVLPPHGGARPVFHRAVRDRVLSVDASSL